MINLPLNVILVLAVITLITCCIAILAIIANIIIQNSPIKMVIAALTLAVHWGSIRYFDEIIHAKYEVQDFTYLMINWFNLPPWMFIIILCVAYAGAIYLGVDFINYRLRYINTLSVKDALDSLPSGILFYLPNGTILLSNKKMNNFVYDLTGKGLLNSKVFINDLNEGNILDNEILFNQDDDAIVKIKNNIYSIKRTDTIYYNKPVRKIMVSNITSEYNMNLELEDNLEHLKRYNQELKQYNKDVVESTKNEEILNTKIKIHDKLGEILLGSKRINENTSIEEKKEYLTTVIDTLNALMSREDNSTPNDDIKDIMEAANAIGVTVNIKGVIPKNNIFFTALHECITNTVKHGHGNRVDVVVEERKRFVSLIITNNGIVPDTVILKGGLLSLSNLCQQKGGSLVITCDQVYKLTITLPKEDKYE